MDRPPCGKQHVRVNHRGPFPGDSSTGDGDQRRRRIRTRNLDHIGSKAVDVGLVEGCCLVPFDGSGVSNLGSDRRPISTDNVSLRAVGASPEAAHVIGHGQSHGSGKPWPVCADQGKTPNEKVGIEGVSS
jgi:hypothetical protein